MQSYFSTAETMWSHRSEAPQRNKNNTLFDSIFAFGVSGLIGSFWLTEAASSFVQLRTCCEFQSMFEEPGTCNGSGSEPFPDFLNISKQFSMYAYGDQSRGLKFSVLFNTSVPLNLSRDHFLVEINLSSPESKNESGHQLNFTEEGYLKVGMDYYAPTEYCINRLSPMKTLFLIIFNSTCSALNPCIRRCCEFGEVWDMSRPRLRCVPSGKHQWSPELYSDPYTVLDPMERLRIQPHFIADHPRNGWCDPAAASVLALRQYKNKTDLFRILEDGTVMRKLRALTWVPLNPNFSCVDGGQNFPGDSRSELFSGNSGDTVIIDCEPSKKDTEQTSLSRAYGISMIISCLFLFVTVVVYFLLWERQNVHSWIIQSYTGNLFFLYIFLALLHFADELHFERTPGYDNGISSCQGIGIALHFFFISTFGWLTIINFDLWWTFRSLKPTAGSKGLKKFGLYTIFALGLPSIIVSVALGLDLKYRDNLEEDIIIPLYGLDRCYMESDKPMLVYVYGPVGVLLSLNMVLFIATILSMYRIQQTTKFASSSSSKNSKQKQSFKLFIKIFFIAGVTWCFEIISYLIGRGSTSQAWYWAIFDFINIFQAIGIFLIFICKREILLALQQKYPLFQRLTNICTVKGATSESLVRRFPRLKGFLTMCQSSRSAKSGESSVSGKSMETELSSDNGTKRGEKIGMS